MAESIIKNEKCFIGMPSCGYGYESAKLCFVACPSDEKYTLKIEVIENIVESKQYECHIASKRIDPAELTFCKKICSKIIQSQFCIVLLDFSADKKGVEHPNPNVHFEYGMMLSLNKHIIPLQDEKYELPFNVAPLDTIKYNDTNFKSKVTEAVDNAIKKFSNHRVSGQIPQGDELLMFYSIAGYKFSDIREEFLESLSALGSHLEFFLFDNKGKWYKYVGSFNYEDPKKVILYTKLLIDNLISAYEASVSSGLEESEKGAYDYLKDNISIDIILPPLFEKKDIRDKINKIINRKYKYPIKMYYLTDIQDEFEKEYQKIGDVKPRNSTSA